MNKRLILIVLALVMVGSITGMAAQRHTINAYEAGLIDGTIWSYTVYVADLGTAGSTDAYLIKTPATGTYHMCWCLNAGGGMYMQVYENPTIVSTQTESTVYCKNRVKDTATTVQLWTDANFVLDSAGSTIIKTVMTGTTYTISGSSTISSTGWWLKQSEEYYVLITAIAANPGYGLTIQWHLHE